MALKQENRLLSLKTPLGDDTLVLTSFRGEESISKLFEFHLDMISDDNQIKASDIVGKDVTVGIELVDGSERFLHGFVHRFAAGDEDENGRRNYQATVVPWLWFLTQTADCRIFQNKTVPDIIEQVFQDLGFSDFDTADIQGEHKQWEYCVQYRETDFNFVSRLMEQEGIFYFFKFDDGKHTLVLSDQNNACKECQEKEVDFPRDFGTRAIQDYITSWEHSYQFRPGKWAQTDYNFKTPSTNLAANTDTLVDLPNISKYEIYDFPGEYENKGIGDAETKLRMEEEEIQHDTVQGQSFCKSFTAGGKFKLRQHRAATEEGKSFILTSVYHEAHEPLAYETGSRSQPQYRNRFVCTPQDVAFRPARTTRKPFVQGVQTAIVVGPNGEEIYVDEYGRVKVQFHWDREGKKDENSSCWMRVSQIHAGPNFGGIDIPRMGEEVIVSFLEGDPDRPIITGRVYHAENMPPFGLPGAKTISGLKSKTYKGDGYNEYIMDDTPGNELIREHGQYDKDSTIEHDLREHVLNNRSRDVSVNETVQVGNNRSMTVGVNHTEAIGANQSISVGANLTETVGINYSETVGAAMELTVGAFMSHTVGAAYTISVGATMSTSVGGNKSQSVGANKSTSVGGKQSTSIGSDRGEQVGGKVTEKVGGNVSQQFGGKHTEKVAGNYTLKSNAAILLQAANKITLKTGASSIEMTSGGNITIKGTKITIEGTGKIQEKAPQISSEAAVKNVVKGAMVNVEASAVNTIKGALVKIN